MDSTAVIVQSSLYITVPLNGIAEGGRAMITLDHIRVAKMHVASGSPVVLSI